MLFNIVTLHDFIIFLILLKNNVLWGKEEESIVSVSSTLFYLYFWSEKGSDRQGKIPGKQRATITSESFNFFYWDRLDLFPSQALALQQPCCDCFCLSRIVFILLLLTAILLGHSIAVCVLPFLALDVMKQMGCSVSVEGAQMLCVAVRNSLGVTLSWILHWQQHYQVQYFSCMSSLWLRISKVAILCFKCCVEHSVNFCLSLSCQLLDSKIQDFSYENFHLEKTGKQGRN